MVGTLTFPNNEKNSSIEKALTTPTFHQLKIFYHILIAKSQVTKLWAQDKVHLKTQSIYIFYIKYYIIQNKTIKVKVVKERLKKSNMDNNYGTEVVLLRDYCSICRSKFSLESVSL